MEKAKVYFTKEISKEKLLEMYKVLNKELVGNVAVKVHSGEAGNQNFLKPEFMKDLIDYVDGVVVECNTAYNGERNDTSKHLALLKKHHWDMFKVDIMDSDGEIELTIPNGIVIDKNYVGKSITNYNSMLVISHFKGHPMGGFGGALKQLSIGCASSNGKAWIHSGGRVNDQKNLWDNTASQKEFIEAMADAAASVVNFFDGNLAFINIMSNLSVDCDCCAKAEDPCMKDIGILSSLDPIALDQACLDLIYNSNDQGKEHLIERIKTRNGEHIIGTSLKHGFGTNEYELIIL